MANLELEQGAVRNGLFRNDKDFQERTQGPERTARTRSREQRPAWLPANAAQGKCSILELSCLSFPKPSVRDASKRDPVLSRPWKLSNISSLLALPEK